MFNISEMSTSSITPDERQEAFTLLNNESCILQDMLAPLEPNETNGFCDKASGYIDINSLFILKKHFEHSVYLLEGRKTHVLYVLKPYIETLHEAIPLVKEVNPQQKYLCSFYGRLDVSSLDREKSNGYEVNEPARMKCEVNEPVRMKCETIDCDMTSSKKPEECSNDRRSHYVRTGGPRDNGFKDSGTDRLESEDCAPLGPEVAAKVSGAKMSHSTVMGSLTSSNKRLRKWSDDGFKDSGAEMSQHTSAFHTVSSKRNVIERPFILCSYIKGFDFFCLIQEVVSGFTSSLTSSKEIPMYYTTSLLLDLFIDVSIQLSRFHDKKIALRDIKSENMVVDVLKRTLTFIDFDYCSRKFEQSIGTESNIAPEIIIAHMRRLDIDLSEFKKQNMDYLKVDIWSLGCVFYAAMYGTPAVSDYKTYLEDKRSKPHCIDPKYESYCSSLSGPPVITDFYNFKQRNINYKFPLISKDDIGIKDKLKILLMSMLKYNSHERFNIYNVLTYLYDIKASLSQ